MGVSIPFNHCLDVVSIFLTRLEWKGEMKRGVNSVSAKASRAV
jgi:hypothetical protein